MLIMFEQVNYLYKTNLTIELVNGFIDWEFRDDILCVYFINATKEQSQKIGQQ